MSPGTLARRVLGDRWFPYVGRVYRRVFVDLRRVADGIPALPPGAHILDVGGGDGDLMNLVLPRNPGTTATLLDLADNVGGWLRPELRDRVELRPRVSVQEYAQSGRPVDMVILSDVIHHVPADERGPFVECLAGLLRANASTLVVKDVDARGPRARFYYLADRLVTGDRNVSMMPRDELREMFERALPEATCVETDLYRGNPPNFLFVFTLPARA